MNKLKKIVTAIDFLVLSPRLGRMRYIAMTSFWTLVLGGVALCLPALVTNIPELTADFDKFQGFVKSMMWWHIALYLLYLMVGTFLAIRRLNDADFKGWWCLFGFVPIVNFFFGMFLMIYPGTPGANRFGASASATNVFHYILGVITIIITGCFLLALTVGATAGIISTMSWIKAGLY